jgi:hypothetical protein
MHNVIVTDNSKVDTAWRQAHNGYRIKKEREREHGLQNVSVRGKETDGTLSWVSGYAIQQLASFHN